MRKNEPDEQIKAFFSSMQYLRKYSFENYCKDITGAEFFALYNMRLLSDMQGCESIRISELGKKMKLSPQAVSKTLRILEEKGFSRRMTDESDRRITLISITKEGCEVLDKTQDDIVGFAQEVRERMGEKDIAEFVRLNNKFTRITDEIIAERKKSDGQCPPPTKM